MNELCNEFLPFSVAITCETTIQFGSEHIHSFTVNTCITFPLSAITEVKGNNAHELFKWAKTNHGSSAVPKWNFHKILINKEGKIEDTFSSFTKPLSNKIINKIESIL